MGDPDADSTHDGAIKSGTTPVIAHQEAAQIIASVVANLTGSPPHLKAAVRQ